MQPKLPKILVLARIYLISFLKKGRVKFFQTLLKHRHNFGYTLSSNIEIRIVPCDHTFIYIDLLKIPGVYILQNTMARGGEWCGKK